MEVRPCGPKQMLPHTKQDHSAAYISQIPGTSTVQQITLHREVAQISNQLKFRNPPQAVDLLRVSHGFMGLSDAARPAMLYQKMHNEITIAVGQIQGIVDPLRFIQVAWNPTKVLKLQMCVLHRSVSQQEGKGSTGEILQMKGLC